MANCPTAGAKVLRYASAWHVLATTDTGRVRRAYKHARE